jgi:hypothetical protein
MVEKMIGYIFSAWKNCGTGVAEIKG